jgi:hypothetical protein
MSLNLDIQIDGYFSASFKCDVTGRSFILGEGPFDSGLVFYEVGGGDVEKQLYDYDVPLLTFGRNYKTKQSTIIAKCIQWFDDREEFHTGIRIKGRIVVND